MQVRTDYRESTITYGINSIAHELLLSRIDVLKEIEHTTGIHGHTVIGPHQEMILEDLPLFTAAPRKQELSQRVVIGRCFGETSDFGVSPFLLLSRVRPIFLALLLRSLDLLRSHHNHSSIFLPNHAPEIDDCVGQTSLRGDVGFTNEVVVLLGIRHRRYCAEVASNRG